MLENYRIYFVCRTLESDYTQTIYERIHVRGCITAIKESMDTYVMPLLLAWGLIGTSVADTVKLLPDPESRIRS